jgi:hypothetical protein
MNRKQLVEEVIEYFRSPQWHEVLSVVQDRDMNHMHVYVDTSLDLKRSFAPLVEGYFANLGWDAYRKIDIMADKPGKAALYGIQLEDKLNFEIYCRFVKDIALAPMVPKYGERGGNLRVWSVADIRRFQEQFRWREVTHTEEKALEDFFANSSHWERSLEYVNDPDVWHVHCNIETSVHPNVIREYALRDLDRRGYVIKHSIHSIFNGGGYDSGKIIFLGLKPARTFDIAYYYNKDAIIEVNTQETNNIGGAGTGNEYYIVRVSTLLEELAKHQLQVLTADEIGHILETIAGFQKRSAYSWRFVPDGREY